MSSKKQDECLVKCSDCGNTVSVKLGGARQCPYCGQWVASWQRDLRVKSSS